MIPAEQHARIRRLFYAEHWKIGTIASELDVHPDTVRRAIESERFNQMAIAVRSTQLDAYKGFVGDVLERHPRLRSTRLFEMIRQRGYPGSIVQLRRYVRGVRPAAQKEAFLRLRPLMGEEAQVDWGNFGKIRIGNAERILSCFVLVLSWSRAVHARFALDQTLESFLRGHVEAFHAFGGAPRAILFDYVPRNIIVVMCPAPICGRRLPSCCRRGRTACTWEHNRLQGVQPRQQGFVILPDCAAAGCHRNSQWWFTGS